MYSTLLSFFNVILLILIHMYVFLNIKNIPICIDELWYGVCSMFDKWYNKSYFYVGREKYLSDSYRTDKIIANRDVWCAITC